MSILGSVFDSNQRQLKKLYPYLERINKLETSISKLDDSKLKKRFNDIREIARNTKDDEIDSFITENLSEVFAIVREVAKRTLNHRHFDVQILAGIAQTQGKLIELSTGEGKTLVATLSLILYSLFGKGSHSVTVNDYLAKRDAQWCGYIYSFLGLNVGVITPESAFKFASFDDLKNKGWKDSDIEKHFKSNEHKLNDTHGDLLVECSKKDAYNADITYGTNNEFGFDYLRDNLVFSADDFVQRDLFFCIVDEADSVLIDEARTPLIISDPVESETSKYIQFANMVKSLEKEKDYVTDEKTQSVTFTEDGIDKIEGLLNVDDIWSDYSTTYHLENAIKAKEFFIKDDEYIVKDDKVVIVDEFTGRLMPDRRFSEGLHQAIEAKENVEILQESRNLATITFQNYFRLYKYLSGMTGTALTEAEEFFKIYKLEVIVIPTNKPNIRQDFSDRVYRNRDAKFRAVINEIVEVHKSGRPMLVGTTSVETSEYLSRMLSSNGVKHTVLNAKYHEMEAEIISHAGEIGQVTIATNMAGRGTDIVLGDKVQELGGLHIIGTQRHESRRIDNQLRGRAARQGDPGSTRFYVSMDDDLMRIFGGDSVAKILGGVGVSEDLPIESKIITRQIESAQKKVESYNFDIRKSLVEYDDVLSKHREIVFIKRRKFLESLTDTKFDYIQLVMEKMNTQISMIVDVHSSGHDISLNDFGEILTDFYAIVPKELLEELLSHLSVNTEEWISLIFENKKVVEREKVVDQLLLVIKEALEEQKNIFTDEIFRQIIKDLYLQILSYLWTDHIDAMNYLERSIRLQGYAQVDPLVAYKRESFVMFDKFINTVDYDFVRRVLYVQKVEVENTVMAQNLNNNTPLNAGNVKMSRNAPCFCGSGKKYKNCHGKNQ